MAASFNKVMLLGNLTREPEIRYTSGGTAIAQLGMAINRRYKGKNEEWQDETTFVDVEVWGRMAENCNEYLSKGRPVFIEGRLKFDQWEDKESRQKRSKLKVVAESVQFLSGDNGGGKAKAKSQRPANSFDELDEESVPF